MASAIEKVENSAMPCAALLQTVDSGVELEVKLYCHSYPYRRCSGRLCSTEGLYVFCNLDELPTHVFIEAEFSLASSTIHQVLRLPVFIEQRDPEGAFLRFSFGPTTELETLLRESVIPDAILL